MTENFVYIAGAVLALIVIICIIRKRISHKRLIRISRAFSSHMQPLPQSEAI